MTKCIKTSTEDCGYTPRVCTMHQNWEYAHLAEFDLGLQVDVGAPIIAIQSLRAATGKLDPSSDLFIYYLFITRFISHVKSFTK